MSPKKIFHPFAAKSMASLLAVSAALFLAATASAQNFLLTIDASDPNAVVFTTTGSAASADSSATNVFDGVTLLNFFTAEISGSGFANSTTLTPAGTTTAYDRWANDNASGSNIDLNLYYGIAGQTQVFTTTDPAFSGVVIYNLSAFAAQLPSFGAFGNLIAGYSGTPPEDQVTIGSWQVVPEPGACGLLAVGGLALVAMAYRHSALRS